MGFDIKTLWEKIPDETDIDVSALPGETLTIARDCVESLTTGLTTPVRPSPLDDGRAMILKFRRNDEDGVAQKARAYIPSAVADGVLARLVNDVSAYLTSMTGGGWYVMLAESPWDGIGLI
jgi:hypothetical protein